MDNGPIVSPVSARDAAPAPPLCPVCHQPAKQEHYFCPNCGASLREAPLPTSIAAQAGIYVHSIILPMLLFITVSKWRGLKYFRSSDPKAKQVGAIAFVLLIISTLATFWLAYVWTMNAVNSAVAEVNAELSM